MALSKPKYYNIAHLLKKYPGAKYYIAIGERTNGKTYSALDYALDNYFKKGEQFAYIRRFGEDIKRRNMINLFTGHQENGRIAKLSGGQFSRIDFGIGAFTAYEIDPETEKKINDIQPIGYAFDLNSVDHHKSLSFPKVTTIIFDEFLSRQGYLSNEYVLFMNTLSTIIRDRDNVTIFMLGNTVNKYSPYFVEMGLTHIRKQDPGTVDVYTYGDSDLSVVVEYCDPMSKRGGKKSDVYFAFDNPQLKMITSGSWEIALYPHLKTKYRPKDVVQQFFIEFDEILLHVDVVVTENEIFLFVHPKTTLIKDIDKDLVYSNKPSGKFNYRCGIHNQNDRLSRVVQSLINQNRIFYSDNETGEVLRNYLLWSKQYSSARGG